MHTVLLFLIIAALQASPTNAADGFGLRLYNAEIPGAIAGPDREHVRDPQHPHTFLLDVSRPTLTAYLPAPGSRDGASVIICPGGGYRGVSIVKEGSVIAAAFNRHGVSAFVLKYRTPDARTMADQSLGALQDLQQAISVVRKQAAALGLDPHRLGVMGFSAGGHLAASAATRFAEPASATLDGENLRPDFVILIYPVISMMEDIGHAGSRERLLGTVPSPQAMASFSNELLVTAASPPTFLMHAGDDPSVPVENSLRYFQALQQHGVAAAMLVYPSGEHGFGLDRPGAGEPWFGRLVAWLQEGQWLRSRAE